MPSYRVKGVFATIQGEGVLTGTPAVFLRFAACNLWSGIENGRPHGRGACAAWCDTDFAGGEPLTLGEVMARVECERERDGATLCVITGGEPTLQLDAPLVDALHSSGLRVNVETNGWSAPEALFGVDMISVSPKRPMRTEDEGASRTLVDYLATHTVSPARELKIVAAPAGSLALKWTPELMRQYAERAYGWTARFVMPCDPPVGSPPDQHLANIRAARELLAQLPGWRLGIQAHKTWSIT